MGLLHVRYRRVWTGTVDPLLPFEIWQAMTAIQGLRTVIQDVEHVGIAHDGIAPMG